MPTEEEKDVKHSHITLGLLHGCSSSLQNYEPVNVEPN